MTKSAPQFRTHYDDLQPSYSALTGISFAHDKGHTHQSFKDECDINQIIKNLDVRGFLEDRGETRTPQYFDATQVPDFHEAQNQIAYANQLFFQQPAEVRARFRNDPAEMVDFFKDPANMPEAAKLGLVSLRELPPERPHEPSAGGNSSAPAKALKTAKKAPSEGA